MAVIGNTVATLVEWAKRTDPDGKIPRIVEMLSQTNEILKDMLFMEGNLPTGHRITMRTGLPSVAWRLLNQGVQPSKSTTAQVDEQAGMLEAWSEVDKDLAMLNGNTSAFRLSEAQSFIESMNQMMAQTLFYGNSAIAPETFTGFAPRYSTVNKTVAPNAKNVLDGGGTGSTNLSIWLVVWGAQTVAGIFPKGSQAGILHEDLGEETAETVAGLGGARMRVYRDRWQWKAGLALKDWRYVVRIANIDVPNLVANTGSQAMITQLMIKALHRVQNLRLGTPVFYMGRTAMEFLDIQRRNDVLTGGQLSYRDVDGMMEYAFRGVPVRLVDQLLETEARVV
jgi:hypothetical protein